MFSLKEKKQSSTIPFFKITTNLKFGFFQYRLAMLILKKWSYNQLMFSHMGTRHDAKILQNNLNIHNK